VDQTMTEPSDVEAHPACLIDISTCYKGGRWFFIHRSWRRR